MLRQLNFAPSPSRQSDAETRTAPRPAARFRPSDGLALCKAPPAWMDRVRGRRRASWFAPRAMAPAAPEATPTWRWIVAFVAFSAAVLAITAYADARASRRALESGSGGGAIVAEVQHQAGPGPRGPR